MSINAWQLHVLRSYWGQSTPIYTGAWIKPFIKQINIFLMSLRSCDSYLELNYDPDHTHPIPYSAFETEHISVSPSYFHPASHLWNFSYRTSCLDFKPHPAYSQIYVGTLRIAIYFLDSVIRRPLNYWSQLLRHDSIISVALDKIIDRKTWTKWRYRARNIVADYK